MTSAPRSGFDVDLAGKRAECDGGNAIAGTHFAGRQDFAGTLTGEYVDHGDPPWRWYVLTDFTGKPEGYTDDTVWCESGNLFIVEEQRRGRGMKTLLERMGGASAVFEALEGLHDRMLADDTLAPFLEGVDVEVWTSKQFDFLGRMLGASEYDSETLRRSHQRLVDKGLDDPHFDVTLEYLQAALRDAEVPEDCIPEVTEAFESTRRDILCR